MTDTVDTKVLQANIKVAKEDFAGKISTDISTEIENLQGTVFNDVVGGLFNGIGSKLDTSKIASSVLPSILLGASQADIYKKVSTYLSPGSSGDNVVSTLLSNVSDKLSGTVTIDIALHNLGEKGKKWLEDLHTANTKFGAIKTQGDLDLLRKELHLDNEDVMVEEKDFYQDDDAEKLVPSDTIDISNKKQILSSSIISEPLEWNKTTGVTWCSLTARKNSKNLGIDVPNGNAFDVKNKSPIDPHYKTTIEKSEKETFSLDDMDVIDPKINVADVFVYSTGKYAKFGHRCMMFKNMTDKQWYVLDPYRASQSNGSDRASKIDPSSVEASKPKLLEDYITYNKIAKINFYESPYAVVNQYDADAIV